MEPEENPTPAVAAFVELAPGTIASDFALRNLNKALGEAQNEFEDAVKSATNTYGGWKYTPLKAIVDAVRPALTKYHLTVSQIPFSDLETKTVTLHTRLVHWDSGEWLQSALDMPGELALGKDGAPKFNQQTIGGSLTYAQKYAYKSIVGIPDGEEMIDSTDEKGDLPARAKTQAKPKQTARHRSSGTGTRGAGSHWSPFQLLLEGERDGLGPGRHQEAHQPRVPRCQGLNGGSRRG